MKSSTLLFMRIILMMEPLILKNGKSKSRAQYSPIRNMSSNKNLNTKAAVILVSLEQKKAKGRNSFLVIKTSSLKRSQLSSPK